MIDPLSAKQEDEDMSLEQQRHANLASDLQAMAIRDARKAWEPGEKHRGEGSGPAPEKPAADLWYEHEEATRAALAADLEFERAQIERMRAEDTLRFAEHKAKLARIDQQTAYKALLAVVGGEES